MARYVVAMSGGVDSAVAASLLLDAGHDVQGLFMANWEDDGDGYCTTASDFQDARRTCAELGIPLHRVSFAAEYRERVFAYFLAELRAGRTPNPDVLCNREIKFGLCLAYARRLGAERFATGHYARIGPGGRLLRGVDAEKDQSYFLHMLSKLELAGCDFPVGGLCKPQVRVLARERGLPVYDKRDSTGICFIGERPFGAFLEPWLPGNPGPDRDTGGHCRRTAPGPRALHARAAQRPRCRWTEGSRSHALVRRRQGPCTQCADRRAGPRSPRAALHGPARGQSALDRRRAAGGDLRVHGQASLSPARPALCGQLVGGRGRAHICRTAVGSRARPVRGVLPRRGMPRWRRDRLAYNCRGGTMQDSFKARRKLTVGGRSFEYFGLDALAEYPVGRLPYALKILLENLLRHEDGTTVTREDIVALASADPRKLPAREIAFTPARVIMQDFTGVPAVVDLAAMRDAMAALGGDPGKINPLIPAELVIDHSVMVDHYGSSDALNLNALLEFQRNKERYTFLRWGQSAFDNFAVVPPDTGIVHQVNLEFLARVVFVDGRGLAYPDTVVGTDSHTTMINGVGVLGWGVGGIEAEAAMLGQPSTMLIPEVIGMKLTGRLPEGATATDLVLTVTEQLRKRGVVEKFVEFFGDGLAQLPLADRATIANMAPEYGATCGIFPIDEETLTYLRLTGRDEGQIALVREYAKAQGMWRHDGAPDPVYTDVLYLDLSTVQPSLAGPKRPQDRVLLSDMQKAFRSAFEKDQDKWASRGPARVNDAGREYELKDGAVVIAAITSCTNTSNPAVMVGAGLLARKAKERGLTVKPWVKTSMAPGSKVVTEYLTRAGLLADLENLGFNIVGYGCTTCIGNSGPLNAPISKAVGDNKLSVASVLSGNRNFEGRVHQEVRMNFLASPPLVVAYALAGSVDMDLTQEPIGLGRDDKPVYLRDIWPSANEIQQAVGRSVMADMFVTTYSDVFKGDERWRGLGVTESRTYRWDSRQHLHPESSLLHRHGPPTARAARDSRGPLSRVVRRLDHDRSHFARRGRSARNRRPVSICSGTVWRRRTSTATGRGAAITR